MAKIVTAKEIRFFLKIITIAICFFVFVSCNTVEGKPKNRASTETISFISKNTQGTFFNDLKIGVGNFWEEEYTDDNGKTQKGITCGLWFFVKRDSSQNKHVRVYPGKKVFLDDYYLIEVIDMDKKRVGLKIRLLN